MSDDTFESAAVNLISGILKDSVERRYQPHDMGLQTQTLVLGLTLLAINDTLKKLVAVRTPPDTTGTHVA